MGEKVADGREVLDLNNFCEGSLNREFQEQYTSIISQLIPGEKGSIAITIGIMRPEEVTTMAALSYTVNGRGPKRKKVQYATIKDGCELLVDAPKPKPKLASLPFEEAK